MIRGGAAPPFPARVSIAPLCTCPTLRVDVDRLAPLSLPVPQKPSSPAPCKEVITLLSHPRTFLKRKKLGCRNRPAFPNSSAQRVFYIYICVCMYVLFFWFWGVGAWPSPHLRHASQPPGWSLGGQVGLWGAEGEGSVSFPRPSFSFFYWFVVCSSWLCRFLILHQGFF